jgi:prepilin-type N-terminal cleavage/methylation domain-containing protein
LKSLPDANYKPLRHSGFTLIEALVAMALIAIIAVMSFQAVEVVMQADQRSRDKLSDETQLHRAWQIIHRDLMHLRNRTFKLDVTKAESCLSLLDWRGSLGLPGNSTSFSSKLCNHKEQNKRSRSYGI